MSATHPPRKPGQDWYPIQQAAYDLVLALVPTIEAMPRIHRFTLGDRLINLGYEIIEQVTITRYSREKRDKLRRINLLLERLRVLLRLAVDLRAIPVKAYGRLGAMVNEVGRMAGGWSRKLARDGAP
jgi:hypothetical protein